MPLHVLMDGRMLIGRFSGVSRFVTSLANALSQREDVRITLLCGAEPFPDGVLRDQVGRVFTNFQKSDRSPIRRLIWERSELSRIVKRCRPDVYHATWNTGIPKTSAAPSLLTVHDVIPLHSAHRGVLSRIQHVAYRCSVCHALRRAKVIVTVSDHVRSAIYHLGIPTAPMQTIHHGVPHVVDNAASRYPELNSGLPFALYVGGHEERKNVAGLLAAMQAFWAIYSEPLDLWLTGRERALSPPAASALRRLMFRERVRFVGDPDDAELTRLYRSAKLLLFLSHDEGFGLPAAEAMAAGCPVIASNRASLPEIVGDGGVLVNPDQPEGVAAAMMSLIHDDRRRNDVIEHGLKRSQAFRWENAASSYLMAYRNAIAKRNEESFPTSRERPRILSAGL